MNTDDHGDTAPSRTVLLVDDETMVLEVGKAILQRLGHEVITAQNGDEALDQYLRQGDNIGCVVLDLTMPGMDGQETFRQLRKLAPEIPVIIASGLSGDQVAGQFAGIPATAVIQKPYQIADLSATIQNLLNDRS